MLILGAWLGFGEYGQFVDHSNILLDPSQARDDRAIGGKFYADTSLRSVWGFMQGVFITILKIKK